MEDRLAPARGIIHGLVLGVLCWALIIAGIVLAPKAFAHTGDLHASGECQADGTYKVTYTLTLSNSNLSSQTWWKIGNTSFAGTPNSNAGMPNGPIAHDGTGTITLGTETYPGNYNGAGNWVYAFTKWTDNYTKGSDGRIDSIKAKCAQPTVKDAAFTKSVSDATCDTAAILTFSGTAVTFSQASPVNGPGSKTVTATPVDGHEWVGGGTEARTVFSGTLADRLPKKQCSTQPAPKVEKVTDSKQDCTGIYSREGTITTEYVWSDQADDWVLGTPGETVWGDWTKVRDLTDDEYFDECAPPMPKKDDHVVDQIDPTCNTTGLTGYTEVYTYTWNPQTREWVETVTRTPEGEQQVIPVLDPNEHPECRGDVPAPKVESASSSSYECGDGFKTVTTTTSTTGYIWDADSKSWVLGEPVVTSSTEKVPTDVVACPTKTVKHVKNVKVTKTVEIPHAVDAGLAGEALPNTGGPSWGLGMFGAGAVLLGGALLTLRRRRVTE